ncbi:MAG TPA: plastocyanin/azurin family copper-binding protein [Solirubrobacteraceae bacterium]|nr:plastocyanin/azurin family copper-binding protein [Solirubrobacteraceae bacterium]
MKKLAAGCATAVAAAALAVPAFAATKTIKVDDNVFAPRSATAKKGDTLNFRWVGEAPHNVKVQKGPQMFGSKVQRSGSYKVKVRKAGAYTIVCTIHPGMTLKLRVK